MFSDFNPIKFLFSMAALIICIGIHEFAHAYSALMWGDDTAKRQGRVSLNPFEHLDTMGTIMMVLSSLTGFGFGWGKPVPINPANFRNPRLGILSVSIWGPLSNIITAFLLGLVIRFAHSYLNYSVLAFTIMVIQISLVLAVFNLIPIAPLDGSKILMSLLPHQKAMAYSAFCARYGTLLFLGMVLFLPNALSAILSPPVMFLMRLFTGLPI